MVTHAYRIFPTPMGYKHISYCDQVRETTRDLKPALDADCRQCIVTQQDCLECDIEFVRGLGTPDVVTKLRIDALKNGVSSLKALNRDFFASTEPAARSGTIMKSAMLFLTPHFSLPDGGGSHQRFEDAKQQFADCCLLKIPHLCTHCERFVEQESASLEVSTAMAVIRIVAALKIDAQGQNYLRRNLYSRRHRPIFDDLVHIRNKLLAHWDPAFVGDIRLAKSPMLFPGWARIRPKLLDFFMESVKLCDEELSRKVGIPMSSGSAASSGQIFNYPMHEEDYEGIYKAILGP